MSEKESFGLIQEQKESSEDAPSGLDEMLPGGLCHYDGPEADLPVGGYSKLPGWGPERAAERWLVASPETEAGYIEKKTRELSKNDIIIGVELHERLLEIYAETYGPKFYLIREANGGPLMTRSEWRQRFGTDGMALVAIRNKRQELAGERQIISI